MKSTKTIYTCFAYHSDMRNPAIVSYTSQKAAAAALTDYVVAHLQILEGLARDFNDDINHPDMMGSITFEPCGEGCVITLDEKRIREYVYPLLNDGYRYVINPVKGFTRHTFDIMENTLTEE